MNLDAMEWILGLCATLASTALIALVAIGWKSREALIELMTDFSGFKSQVPKDISAMGQSVQATMQIEVGKLTERFDRLMPLESRLRAVEDHATLIKQAHADYQPWRVDVDRKLGDLDKRVSVIEDDKK